MEFKQCAPRVRRRIFQSTCPRGARRIPHSVVGIVVISIHVPTRGTTPSLSGFLVLTNFNPRAHEGHDLGYDPIGKCHAISIHVPTRGTTRRIRRQRPDHNFNPRAHEGHDKSPIGITRVSYFNPRAHEGHDNLFPSN